MPDQMTDTSIIKSEKQIIKDIAGLAALDEITFNDRGWDSRVYSFDDGRYFFKFPRSQKIQNLYKYEIEAIKFIADLRASIVAQKILWEHPENAYFGYEGVRGQALSTIIDQLDNNQKRAIGEALGDFLRQFHELKLPGARIMGVEDESNQIRRWYEKCRETVQKRFDDDEQQKLHELIYVEWPAKLKELGNESVLCHGDLHFENILVGSNGSVGIIDFGDVAYYDRSKDFLELEEDKEIFQAVLRTYGTHDPSLQQKIAVRQAMIQLINLGFHAGKGDEDNITRTVEKIRAKL